MKGKAKKGNLRSFWLALFVTLLAAVAVCAVLLALVRMEETMNSGDFTLFSLHPDREDGLLELTALGRYYLLEDLATERGNSLWEQVVGWLPAEWRVFCGLLEGILGEIGRFVGNFL